MIEIPPDRLSREVLDAIIEAYVLREGTDYGDQEYELTTKVDQVRRQVMRGDVLVLFDADTETCNLMTRKAFRQLQHNNKPADEEVYWQQPPQDEADW